MKLTKEISQDPWEVIYNAIVQSDRDWSTDEPSAVIFGIVCGWHEVLPEVAEKFDWTEEKTYRLGRLRASFVAQCPAAAED
jgi:hypothetical protein